MGQNPSEQLSKIVITGWGSLLLLLHAVAFVAPTGGNWGFHFFAFLPIPIAGVMLVLSALALLPFVQRSIIAAIGDLIHRWGTLPAPVRRLGMLAGWGIAIMLFWLLRERAVLLGDGALAVRSLTEAEEPARLSHLFRTAPLSALAAWGIRRVSLLFDPSSSAELAWRYLSILSGGAAIFLAARIARQISRDPVVRFLVFSLLLLSGTAQLFFGYVETYPLTFVLTLGFIAASLRWLKEERGMILIIPLFTCMVLSHLSTVVFVPGLILLLIIGLKRNGPREIVAGTGIAIPIAILTLRGTGFTAQKILALADLPGETRLPILASDGTAVPYGIISLWHMTDLLNLLLLLSPYALPVALFRKQIVPSLKGESGMQFLLLMAAGGLAWLSVTHFTIGMSRDWDVAAVSSAGWLTLCILLWGRWGDSRKETRPLLAAVAIMTLIHTAAWVGTNGRESSSIARFETLYTERLWTPRAGAYAFEDLSNLSRSQNDYFSSVVYSAKGLAIDSTNPRRWLHFAGAAALARMDDEAMKAYTRGIATGQAEPGHYRDFARLHLRSDRLPEAIAVLEEGARRVPHDGQTLVMLGDLYVQRRDDPAKALASYRAALESNPGLPGVGEKINRLEDDHKRKGNR